MKPCERELHLLLDSGDPRYPKARRVVGAVVRQGRLANARLALNDQDRALAAAHVANER
jgi:hypothetical protein